MTLIARRSVLGAMAVAAGGLLHPSRGRTAALSQEVRIAVSSSSFVIGGLKIGQQIGAFNDHGLDLRTVVLDSGNAAMSALLSGSVPLAVTGPPEVLVARARGQPCAIVANLYAGFAGSLVLGKAVAAGLSASTASPVHDRLRALDSVLLAVPSPTSVLVAPIREAVRRAGVKVRFTYMAQGAMPAALDSGAVQGMVASFPFAGVPVFRGTGEIWIDGPGGDLPADLMPASSSCIETTTAYAAGNTAVIDRVQRSVAGVASFITGHSDAARAALAAAYPQLAPAELDLAFDRQWRNWTKPVLTSADIEQEVRLLQSSIEVPGLDALKPGDVLLPDG